VLARRAAHADWAALLSELAPLAGPELRRVATTLERALPALRRAGELSCMPEPERLAAWARALGDGSLRPEAAELALRALISEPQRAAEAILQALSPSGEEQRALAEVEARQSELTSSEPAARLRWAMGVALRERRGRVDTRALRALLERSLAAGEQVAR